MLMLIELSWHLRSYIFDVIEIKIVIEKKRWYWKWLLERMFEITRSYEMYAVLCAVLIKVIESMMKR